MFYDPTHNVLVYDKLDRELEVLAHVPGAKKLVNGYVGVPVNLYALQLLCYYRVPVPLPLGGETGHFDRQLEYNFPHGPSIVSPLASQKVRANFLALNPHALDLSDMGTGKTLTALWAADYIMRHTPGECRCLILATLSTLRDVWGEALFQHFMGARTFEVLHGDANKRLRALERKADFYILNHDGIKTGVRTHGNTKGQLGRRDGNFRLEGFAAELASRTDIKIAIIDEIGHYRDHRSLRSRVVKSIVGTRDYVWGLTGTPCPNGPLDAYGIAKIINGCGGESFRSYQTRVTYDDGLYRRKPRAGSEIEASKLLMPAIRYTLDEIVDLPPMTEQFRDVELTDEQVKYMKKLKQDLLLELDRGTFVSAVNQAALRAKFLQLCAGQVYDTEHAAHYVDCKPRISGLKEIIEEASGKVIVFCSFTSVVNMLKLSLADYHAEVVNGQVSGKERDRVFHRFRTDPFCRVLVGDPGSMGHGVTLVEANTIVWYTTTDKNEYRTQANARIRRPGQTRTQTIINLVATKTEREIFNRLIKNSDMQDVILNMLKEERV